MTIFQMSYAEVSEADRQTVERLTDRELLIVLIGAALNHSEALTRIERRIQSMSDAVVTRAQLDAAIASLLAAEAARDAAVIQAFNDLLAKVAAGEVTTPEDFTAELATINTLLANASALTQTATADDPGPTTVTAAPAAPPAPATPAAPAADAPAADASTTGEQTGS